MGILGLCGKDFGSGGGASWQLYDGNKDGVKVAVNASTLNASSPVEVVRLSDTRALVFYTDSNNSSFGTVSLINTSGVTAVVVDTLVFNSTSTTPRACVIDSRYAAVVYHNATGMRGRIIDSDSDTLVAVGSEQTLSNITSAAAWNFAIDLLDSTHIICTFINSSDSSDFYASVIEPNTGTGVMTDATAVEMSATSGTSGRGVEVFAYSASKFVAYYIFTSGAYLVGCSVSGTTPSLIDEANLSSATGTTSYTGGLHVNADDSLVYLDIVPNSINDNLSVSMIVPYDDTAGSSAISSRRLNGAGGKGYKLLHMDTVLGDEYFLSLAVGEIPTSALPAELRGIRHNPTLGYFSNSASSVDTGAENGSALTRGIAAMGKISTTKALIAIRDESASNALTLYIANL